MRSCRSLEWRSRRRRSTLTPTSTPRARRKVYSYPSMFSFPPSLPPSSFLLLPSSFVHFFFISVLCLFLLSLMFVFRSRASKGVNSTRTTSVALTTSADKRGEGEKEKEENYYHCDSLIPFICPFCENFDYRLLICCFFCPFAFCLSVCSFPFLFPPFLSSFSPIFSPLCNVLSPRNELKMFFQRGLL